MTRRTEFDEAFAVECALGHVDEVRRAVGVHPPGRRGCGEEARMPAHDDADIDAG